jgi:hypothetical protein
MSGTDRLTLIVKDNWYSPKASVNKQARNLLSLPSAPSAFLRSEMSLMINVDQSSSRRRRRRRRRRMRPSAALMPA